MQTFEPRYRMPMMQIRNKSLLFYAVPTQSGNRQCSPFLKVNISGQLEETKKPYSGNITKGSKKRLQQKIDLLLQYSPPVMTYNPISKKSFYHTLSFITLTISSKESHLTAKEGHKKLLEPWLLRMRRKAGMKTYIWKAEFQKNGQLHYHITTPSFIEHTLIRNEWNYFLAKENLMTHWEGDKETGPNSTDVHAVYKVKNLQAYLTKYLSKDNKDQNTIGKIWDCSMNLKKAKFFTCEAITELANTKQLYEVISLDYIEIIKTDNPRNLVPPQIRELYEEYLKAFNS